MRRDAAVDAAAAGEEGARRDSSLFATHPVSTSVQFLTGSHQPTRHAAAAALKEVARSFRWSKAFAAAAAKGYRSAALPQGEATLVPVPIPPPDSSSSSSSTSSSTKVIFKGRYTNFSLGHIWEKYDFLQTHLLLQEALLLQQGQQPELLQPELQLQQRPMVNLSLQQPKAGPLDDTTR
ncbi:hypothetical protein Esti_001538 [Eimeria stiedai]